MTRHCGLLIVGVALLLRPESIVAESAMASPPVKLPKINVPAYVPLRKVDDFHLRRGRACSAVVAYGDCLYIIAGEASSGELLDSVEQFDIRTGRSREFARLGTARFRHRAVLVGDKIYVLGGESRILVQNPADLARSAMEAPAEERMLASDSLPGVELDDSVEIIDLKSGKVTAGPRMPDARSNFGCVVVDQKIFVIGGKCLRGYSTARTNRTEVLELKRNRWTPGVPMPTPRQADAVIVDGPFIVVPGGFDGRQASSAVEAFNPRTGIWANVPPLCRSTSSNASVFLGNYLFLFGDYDLPGEIMAYDLRTKRSETFTLGYRAARDAAAVVQNNRIWVVGGKTLAGSEPTDLIQVFEPTKSKADAK